MQLMSIILSVITLAFFAGCGGGPQAGSTVAASKASDSSRCLNCHATATSPGTGALIVDEWLASTHNLKNGAGCADCHEPPTNHPNDSCAVCHAGSTSLITKNPDAAGKCLKCHGVAYPTDLMMVKAPQHFGYSTATLPGLGKRASFVSGQYVGRCSACHNPHLNTVTQQNQDWAKSLHGNPKGEAWTHYEFKQDKYAACNRCHTSTGYISYVTSNFTVPTTGFGAGDSSRELLACNACHTSYNFKNSVRRVAAYTAPYTAGGKKVTFPDNGATNLCIPCHAGRASGDDVNAVADYSNASFVNSHYMAAAGLMYMAIGFKDFTTATAPVNPNAASRYSYGDSYTLFTGPATTAAPAGQVNSAHRRFGTPLINGDTHVAPNKGRLAAWLPGTMDTGGPCVTCHLNAHDSNGVLSTLPTPTRTTSHTLAINDNTWNQVCINCHGSEGPVATFLEENSGDFKDALNLALQVLLTKYKIAYTTTFPYFYDLTADPTGKTAVKDWTRGTGDQVFGRRMMGACFNVNLLLRDPAAYVHARTYARRLIYDSIDYLDDQTINMSVGSTATTLDPVNYIKRGAAFSAASPATTSSRAFSYLCNQTQPERK